MALESSASQPNLLQYFPMADLLINDAGSIRTLTLNRPHARNALTPGLQQQLIDELDAAAADPSLRLLILTATGDHFCAGLDLSALQAMSTATPAQLTADAARISRLFRTLFEFPLPTLALVRGYALAGGTGLATFCDFTFAIPEAQFGYTEARIGFVPALVSAYLALQAGDKRARDLLLTARLFSAAEALSYGLLTEVVASEQLQLRAETLAKQLLANSPTSLRATKQLLSAQRKAWLDQALEHSLAANAASRQTSDFREGVAAFLEKRRPTWK